MSWMDAGRKFGIRNAFFFSTFGGSCTLVGRWVSFPDVDGGDSWFLW